MQDTVPSVMNGLDVEMPNGKWFGDPLLAAVKAGTVPEAVIDEHLVRRFRTMMKFGVWDHLPAHQPIPEKEKRRDRAAAGRGGRGAAPQRAEPVAR